MTTIRYFIPEDGDAESQPNVFLAPKPRQQGYPPSLGQIKQSFPLPGHYHFRFKAPMTPGGDRDKGAMPVWMDCVDDRQPVPTWRQSIVAKVTRLSVEEEDDDDDDDDFHRAPASNGSHHHHTPAPAQPTQPPQPPQRATAPVVNKQPSLDIFDAPAAVPGHSASMPNSAHSSTGNLLDPTGDITPTSSTGGGGIGSMGSGDLLGDMNHPPSHHHHHHHTPMYHSQTSTGSSGGGAAPAHNDFLGMTSTTTTSPPNSYGAPTTGMPGQRQQHPHQNNRPLNHQSSGGNSFDSFSQQQGPFGGLGTPWKS